MVISSKSRCMSCAIRHTTICKGVSPADLPGYSELHTNQAFTHGALLAKEESLADSVFILRQGIVIAYRISHEGKRQIVQLMFTGDVLGTSETNRHRFSLQATTDALVCRFDRKALEAYLRRHPALEAELVLRMRRKIFGFQELLVTLAGRNSLQSVASFIYYLALRQRFALDMDSGPIRIPFTRADICDFLSLTTETISRCLSKLRKDGVIRMKAPNDIEILDDVKLFAAANHKYEQFDSDFKEMWG
jgi:CRP/FNR family transcriptional regulator